MPTCTEESNAERSSGRRNKDDITTIFKTRQQLKERIIKPSTVFRGHEKERAEVLGLLKRTSTLGESNSALLIGPRGCGKTTLLTSVLEELAELNTLHDHSLVVKLNGLIHTNDNLALRDAALQMGLENVIGDQVFGSFAENLKFLFDSLKAGTKERSKAVLFFLDEFELFCEHNNQTLLYNLFDVAQSNQAPICVIGITCRLDITELLEKRVKSRFSHRQIYLFPQNHDIGQRVKLFRYFLRLDALTIGFNDFTKDYIMSWNRNIDEIAANPGVKSVLQRMYDIDVSETTLRTFLTIVVSQLDIDHSQLKATDFTEAYKDFSRDAKTCNMESLSVLEMCLIIAMKHHADIYDSQPFNFEVVLERYLKFLRQNNSSQTTSRPVIMKAYEHLLSLECIGPIGGNSGQKEYQLCHLLILPHQVDDAIKTYKNLPTEVEQWAKSSLQ